MTLVPYDPDSLDKMSLRVLDLCMRIRKLANQCREEQLPPVELHDRKSLEWLDKLEDWLYRAEAEVNRCVHKNHGERAVRGRRNPRDRNSRAVFRIGTWRNRSGRRAGGVTGCEIACCGLPAAVRHPGFLGAQALSPTTGRDDSSRRSAPREGSRAGQSRQPMRSGAGTR